MVPRRHLIPMLVALGIALGLAGCYFPSAAPPIDHNATAAAQTIAAQLTALAMTAAAPAPTTPAPPTEVVVTPTLPPALSPTPTLTNTPTTVPCDRAQFVRDVTYPDGTDVAPGASFIKTWQLRNIGTCTWTSSYALVFDRGDAMGAPASVQLTTGTVAPGQTVDVSVNLTAPTTPRTYQGFFRLRNAAGVVFGIGDAGTAAFWVKIDVVAGRTIAYSFVDNVCRAEWRSAAGVLPCPGRETDANGFVIVVDPPRFENDVTEDEPALQTHPQWVNDGWIQGWYPPITVQAGDRFQTYIGCRWRSGGSACNVRYELSARTGGGPWVTLGTWTETYDGNWTKLDIDLSAAAGTSVEFLLGVHANGPSAQDWALWLNPVIMR